MEVHVCCVYTPLRLFPSLKSFIFPKNLIEEIYFMAEKSDFWKLLWKVEFIFKITFCFKLRIQDLNFSGQREKDQVMATHSIYYPVLRASLYYQIRYIYWDSDNSASWDRKTEIWHILKGVDDRKLWYLGQDKRSSGSPFLKFNLFCWQEQRIFNLGIPIGLKVST